MSAKAKQTHSHVRDGKRLVWYTENLWPLAVGLPVFELPLESVKAWTGAPALDEDCWFGGRPATLRDVAKHTARIQATKLEYPIILNDGCEWSSDWSCRKTASSRSPCGRVERPRKRSSAQPPATHHGAPKPLMSGRIVVATSSG